MNALLVTRSLFLLFVYFTQAAASNNPESSFSRTYIRMCLRPEFLQNPKAVPAFNERICASACTDIGSRCQGFWVPDGVCQLFVFDQCSHMTNAANCSQFVWAFVRKQANLPPGQLCPTGYANAYFGSTYKAFNVSGWADGLSKCSSENGLTKFADGRDKDEVTYMHWMKTNVQSGKSYYIGGYSLTNSSTGTWVWQACNVTFLPEVWQPGQPNSGAGYIRADIWKDHLDGVDDHPVTSTSVTQGMCECINPFV